MTILITILLSLANPISAPDDAPGRACTISGESAEALFRSIKDDDSTEKDCFLVDEHTERCCDKYVCCENHNGQNLTSCWFKAKG